MLLWDKDEKSPNPFSFFSLSWFWIRILLSIYRSMWKSRRSSREWFATDWFFISGRWLLSDAALLAHVTAVQERTALQCPLRVVAGVASLYPAASARPWKILHCTNMSVSSQPLLALARLQPFFVIAWSRSWKEIVFSLENCTLVLLWEIRKGNV